MIKKYICHLDNSLMEERIDDTEHIRSIIHISSIINANFKI